MRAFDIKFIFNTSECMILLRDEYTTALIQTDASGNICSPGILNARIHLTPEQNAVTFRQMLGGCIRINDDCKSYYELPCDRCSVEVADDLKVYSNLGDSGDGYLGMYENIYVDFKDYESIDGSRMEFIMDRVLKFNNLIKSYQKLVPIKKIN